MEKRRRYVRGYREGVHEMIPVGTRFTSTFTVSPEVYSSFLLLFKDRNPLHTDMEFAVSKGFSGTVMHGNILNGFLSYFVGECLPIKNVIIHSQDIRYSRPVYLNDTLVLHAEVEEISEAVGVIRFGFYFENAKKIKIASGRVQVGII